MYGGTANIAGLQDLYEHTKDRIDNDIPVVIKQAPEVGFVYKSIKTENIQQDMFGVTLETALLHTARGKMFVVYKAQTPEQEQQEFASQMTKNILSTLRMEFYKNRLIYDYDTKRILHPRGYYANQQNKFCDKATKFVQQTIAHKIKREEYCVIVNPKYAKYALTAYTVEDRNKRAHVFYSDLSKEELAYHIDQSFIPHSRLLI